MTYQSALQYLYDRLPVFHHVGGSAYKPGLDNTIRLLNAFDNPQQKYKTIHIAGTNGKGSVSHMLASVLQYAGYKVGLYTSPHLIDFGERIRVNGHMISQQYVIDFVSESESLFEDIQPSFFEATMAMAFKYFEDEDVDIAVIEVGLGGRLDSTNIITPELSVITNISFDHTAFLGNSLSDIAFEKAGIIKGNIPVVVGEVLPETRHVFEKKAEGMQAPLIFAEEQLQIKSHTYEGEKMLIETSNGMKYRAGLTGIYQLKNIVTVLVAIKQLQQQEFHISQQNISDGLEYVAEATGLQGRWQIIQQNPRIVLDTGHNVAGIEYVAKQLAGQSYSTLRVVIGMVNDKDISQVLSLLPKDAVYYFTQADIARALPAGDLQAQALQIGLKGSIYCTVENAVKAALADAQTDDIIFIGGSNFIVGEALPVFLPHSYT